MRHYRISVSGPAAASAAAIAELTRAGAALGGGLETCWVMSTKHDVGLFQSLSRRHPLASFGLEHFQAFEEELVRSVIRAGELTVMSRDAVLPEGFGCLYDEDGERLDPDLLRAAAQSVDARRSRRDMKSLIAAPHIALTVGKALARFVECTESTLEGDPSPGALDAVRELAVLALFASSPARLGGTAEREYEMALRLTQSTLHAGRSELFERPGEADWRWWLLVLVGSVGQLIDVACTEWDDDRNAAHFFGGEHHLTPSEMLELEARSLLTCCLEVLALFDESFRM